MFLFRHRNTKFWIVVLIAIIIKTIFTLVDELDNKYKNIAFFILLLDIDFYCLNLTIKRKQRVYYEYSCKRDGGNFEGLNS